MGERLAAVETWQSQHERRCDERYAGIQATMGEMKDVLKAWRNGVWAAAAGLLVWAAIQLYSDLKQPTPAAPPVATAVSPAPAPAR